MAGLNIRVDLFSGGLLSNPLKIVRSVTESASGKVIQGALTITETSGSPNTILEKADYTDSEEAVYLLIINTTKTAGKYIYVDVGSQDTLKIGPEGIALFPWYVDNTDGGDISVWSNDAVTGVNVEFTAVELT